MFAAHCNGSSFQGPESSILQNMALLLFSWMSVRRRAVGFVSVRGVPAYSVFRPKKRTTENAWAKAHSPDCRTSKARLQRMRGSRIRRRVPNPCSRSGCVHVRVCSDAPDAEGGAAGMTRAAACGVVVASVPWAEPGSRSTRDFESERAWPMSVANQKTVSGFPHVAWRAAGRRRP